MNTQHPPQPAGKGERDRARLPSVAPDGYRAIDGLTAGDRVTVAVWTHGYQSLQSGGKSGGGAVVEVASAPDARAVSTGAFVPLPACLAAAAVHALLPGLRRCLEPEALFAAYGDSAAAKADFALIDSLVPPACPDAADPLGQNDERRWRVRDAAFHVRWLELTLPTEERCQR